MAKGWEVHGGMLRVYFYYKGDKCREPLNLPPTDQNKAYAEGLVATIKHEIRQGIFDYASRFPNSPRLKQNTFGHYLDIFYEIKARKVAALTLENYQRWGRGYIRPQWGHRLVEDIDTIDIEKWISASLDSLASKSIKEILQIMSQVFDLYGTRHRVHYNPTKPIRVALPDSEDPDVFTRREINLILNTPTERESERNMTEFWLWSGPRTAELIAMSWDYIDLDAGIARYEMGVVEGQYKATKTRRSKRTVELLKPAVDALRRQKAITGDLDPITVEMTDRDNRTIRKVKFRPVWVSTGTGEPFIHIKSYREYWWTNHLEAAGVRYRGPSQCRHTFISQMLTVGMPINWIIAQVGHTSEAMIRKHYGKFIQEDQPINFSQLANAKLGFTGQEE